MSNVQYETDGPVAIMTINGWLPLGSAARPQGFQRRTKPEC